MTQAQRHTRAASPLPQERHPDHSLRDVIVTLLGVLLLTGAVNLAVIALDSAYPLNRTTGLVRSKWDLLEEAPRGKRVDWLILGDSAGNQGVDPARIRQVTGLESLNLCTVASFLALDDAWMLQEWLTTHETPSVVVAVHVYDIWQRRDVSSSALSSIPRNAAALGKFDPPVHLSRGQQLFRAISPWLPLYAQNASLGSLIQHPGRFFQDRHRLTAEGFARRHDAHPLLVQADMNQHLLNLQSTPPARSPRNQAALERLADLTSRHDIRLVLANAPLFEGLAADPNFRTYHAAVLQELDAFAARHDHVDLAFAKPMTFPAGDLENVDHVTAGAARRYTDELVRQIRR